MSHFEQFDIVTVPFPYADKNQTKKRPAIVISSSQFNSKIKHSVCAMITSQKNSSWPLDVMINDLKPTGLPAPSMIRMKLFTIDHQIIISKIGNLSKKDLRTLKSHLSLLMIK